MRLKILRLIIFALFAVIMLGLIQTQIIQNDYYYSLSTNNRIRVIPLQEHRGRILDRNGAIIAGNRISFDLLIIPQEIKDKDGLFEYLGKTLGREKEELVKSYQKKMLAPFTPVEIAKDISRNQAIVLEENRFRFPGMIIQTSAKRFYPFGNVNAHLLGYVGKIDQSRITELKDYGYTMQSIIGYSGIEEYYDRYLKGENGGLQIEVNNRGQQVRVLGLKESINGQDIQLTVDNRLQKAAAELLRDKKGAVIVMDLDSGEVLGLVSAPSFEPNNFVSGKGVSEFFQNPNKPLLNRAIQGQYPPGSVFKIITAITALENHKITPQTSFTCTGAYQLGRRSFHCMHEHGLQDFWQGIAHSCNVYFFNVGAIVGPEAMTKYARMLGLGSLTHIDLPHEESGFIPGQPQKRWYKGDALNMAIGQGEILATPLQLLKMLSYVVSDGNEIAPHILKAVNSVAVEQKLITRNPNVHIDNSNLNTLRKGLKEVVKSESGTARQLDIEGLSVLGKTGTAQAPGGKSAHAWFVGLCSSEKKRIVFCIFIENGVSSYYACQLAKDLLLFMKNEKIL